MPPTIPDFQAEVDRLVQAFSYVRSLSSPLSRFIHLSKIASFHGLSKSECRRAFEIFCNEYPAGEGGEQ